MYYKMIHYVNICSTFFLLLDTGSHILTNNYEGAQSVFLQEPQVF